MRSKIGYLIRRRTRSKNYRKCNLTNDSLNKTQHKFTKDTKINKSTRFERKYRKTDKEIFYVDNLTFNLEDFDF